MKGFWIGDQFNLRFWILRKVTTRSKPPIRSFQSEFWSGEQQSQILNFKSRITGLL
jgi:hypothetical protein